MSNCSFSVALGLLKDGGKVARHGWNGPGQYLELQVPDQHSKMTLPYIFIRTVQGNLVPWVVSQTDLLAEDWVTVEVGGLPGILREGMDAASSVSA